MAYKTTVQWKKTIKGFSQALGYAGEHLSGWARGWMNEAVGNALSLIDADWEGETHWKRASGKISSFGGDHFHPWYTGQLHDSVAGIVSDKHRTVSIQYMQQAATKPQTYEGQVIIGHDWAIRKAQDMARALHFVPGIVASVVVGVPYSEKVDKMQRHRGYLRDLSVQFAANVEDYFTMRAGEYRTRVFVADTKK